MGAKLGSLPEAIQEQIKTITANSGLEQNEENYEKMAEAWAEKEKIFLEKSAQQGLTMADSLLATDMKGGVCLTYSGSLVLIGPLKEKGRLAGYSSIGLRKDVPESVIKEDSALAADIKVGQPIEFSHGPVKSTSAIYAIAVVADEALPAVEQEKRVQEVTVIMTEGFVDVNNALVPVG